MAERLTGEASRKANIKKAQELAKKIASRTGKTVTLTTTGVGSSTQEVSKVSKSGKVSRSKTVQLSAPSGSIAEKRAMVETSAVSIQPEGAKRRTTYTDTKTGRTFQRQVGQSLNQALIQSRLQVQREQFEVLRQKAKSEAELRALNRASELAKQRIVDATLTGSDISFRDLLQAQTGIGRDVRLRDVPKSQLKETLATGREIIRQEQLLEAGRIGQQKAVLRKDLKKLGLSKEKISNVLSNYNPKQIATFTSSLLSLKEIKESRLTAQKEKVVNSLINKLKAYGKKDKKQYKSFIAIIKDFKLKAQQRSPAKAVNKVKSVASTERIKELKYVASKDGLKETVAIIKKELKRPFVGAYKQAKLSYEQSGKVSKAKKERLKTNLDMFKSITKIAKTGKVSKNDQIVTNKFINQQSIEKKKKLKAFTDVLKKVDKDRDIKSFLFILGLGFSGSTSIGAKIIGIASKTLPYYFGYKFIKNPTPQNVADFVLISSPAGVNKISKVGNNVFYRVGKVKINANKVFSSQVLKQGKKFPTVKNAREALRAFRGAVDDNLGYGVSHSTSDIRGLIKNLKSGGVKGGPAGVAGKEDIGLFVTPRGEGSPYFLGLGEIKKLSVTNLKSRLLSALKNKLTEQYSFSLNPLKGIGKKEGVVVLNVQKVSRQPRTVIRQKGFKRSNEWLKKQANKGEAYVTKRSELGDTSELEGIIPAGARVGKITRNSYTIYKGQVVPIYETTVLVGPKVKKVPSSKEALKLISKLTKTKKLKGKLSSNGSSITYREVGTSSLFSSAVGLSKFVSKSRVSSKLSTSRVSKVSKISRPSRVSSKLSTSRVSKVSKISRPSRVSTTSRVSRGYSNIKPIKPSLKPIYPRINWGSKIDKKYKLVVKVYIKVGNKIKEMPIRTTPNRALRYVKGIIDNTTARSFQLKIVGITTIKDIGKQSLNKFRKKKGKDPKVLLFVEKSKYSIDTKGEKTGLSIAKYLKKIKR